jgi:hypothetical protein
MKTLILATVSAFALASAATAAELGAEVALDVTENAAGDYVATPSIDFSIVGGAGNAFVTLTENNGAIELDEYAIGTRVGATRLSFGDQGDIFGAFEGGLEEVGGTTLADPADAHESLIVSVGDASVLVGLTDISTDVTEVENLQATYGLAVAGMGIVGGIDYNLDSKESVLGLASASSLGSLNLATAVTYATETETFAHDLTVSTQGISAFLNGDDSDLLQNVGAGYTSDLNGMTYYVEGAYNLDAEEFTPAAGVSFNF